MKIFVVFSLAALAIASEFKMKMEKNGEEFSAEIKIDVAGQTEEIKVPKHKGGVEVDILNDFNVGLQALKIAQAKECYISAIDASEESPAKLEESLRLAQSKSPYHRHMVKNERSLRVREMTADEVGQKIARHCKGHKLIFTVKVTKDNTEQTALRIIKDRKSKSKRDVTVTSFNACSFYNMGVSATCPQRRLGAQCKFYNSARRVCAFSIKCLPAQTDTGGFAATCFGVQTNLMMKCCDFTCF